jgi:tryptophanyl-tRNA synthetase
VSTSLNTTRDHSTQLETAIASNPSHYRALTGDRPTGPLHIGHLFGTLLNRIRLQQLGVPMLIVIADYQTITDRHSPQTASQTVLELVADYLAVGIDPSATPIFAHSQVPEIHQLLLPFLSLITVAELERNPTVKQETLQHSNTGMNALMFTYPAHQAADILSCHANVIPVGKDQLPHIETARTIARRFNRIYSPQHPYFTPPQPLLSNSPALLGTDGQKMSKSQGNTIPLSATNDQIAQAVRTATTDSYRHVSYEPAARPEVSNLVTIAALCQDLTVGQIVDELQGQGCAALKQYLVGALINRLEPIRARRTELLSEPSNLRQILHQGAADAQQHARATLRQVKQLMHNQY